MDWMLDDDDILNATGCVSLDAEVLKTIRQATLYQYRKIREWLEGPCPHMSSGVRHHCFACFAEFSQGG